MVRTTLDLQFEGRTLDEQYALGDLYLTGELPENDFHIYSSEHGFMGLFPMGGGRYRLIASNPFSKPEKGTEPSLEELQGLLDPSCFVLLVAHDTDADTLDPALRDAASAHGAEFAVRELAPKTATADRTRYETALGRSSVYLVRPD